MASPRPELELAPLPHMSDTPNSQPDPPRRAERRWVVWTLFLLVVVALPFATTAIAVERFQALSPLDEPAHIDYLRRIEQGEVPRVGDRMLPETARDIACRTIAGRVIVACERPEIPTDLLDAEGYSYEAQQPPLYYAATALIRQPIALVVNGFVNSARLAGAIWLAGGLAVLWWFLRHRLRASAVATAIGCTFVGLAPLVVGQTATVNNDAAAVLIGASVLVGYDALRREPSTGAIVLATVGAAGMVMIKPLAILPIGAASLALLVPVLVGQRRLRSVVVALLPALAAIVAYQSWEVIRDARATVPYEEVTDALLAGRAEVDAFPVRTIGLSLPDLLTAYGVRRGVLGLELFVGGVAATMGLLFVYGPSVATAMGAGRRDLQALHIGIVAVALAAPPLLITQSYLAVQRDGGSNPRYGLALIPMMITAIVPWMDDRRGVRVAAAAGAALLLVVTLGGLSTYDIPT